MYSRPLAVHSPFAARLDESRRIALVGGVRLRRRLRRGAPPRDRAHVLDITTWLRPACQQGMSAQPTPVGRDRRGKGKRTDGAALPPASARLASGWPRHRPAPCWLLIVSSVVMMLGIRPRRISGVVTRGKNRASAREPDSSASGVRAGRELDRGAGAAAGRVCASALPEYLIGLCVAAGLTVWSLARRSVNG